MTFREELTRFRLKGPMWPKDSFRFPIQALGRRRTLAESWAVIHREMERDRARLAAK